MSFTAPETFVVAQIVTAGTLNLQIRDNIRYLKGLDGTVVLEAGQEMTGTQSYHRLSVLTQAQKEALPGTAAGVVIYDSTRKMIEVYGTAWEELVSVPGTSVQGDITYRTGTAWQRLPPGTAGQVLRTGGAAADPSWYTPQIQLIWWVTGAAGRAEGTMQEFFLPPVAIGTSADGIYISSPGTLRRLLVQLAANSLVGTGTADFNVNVNGTRSVLGGVINAGATSQLLVTSATVAVDYPDLCVFEVNTLNSGAGTVRVRQVSVELI